MPPIMPIEIELDEEGASLVPATPLETVFAERTMEGASSMVAWRKKISNVRKSLSISDAQL